MMVRCLQRVGVLATLACLLIGAARDGAAAGPRSARACSGFDYNRLVLDIIRTLPEGGGYSTGKPFQLPTVTAHNLGAGNWEMRVFDGFPSHCASAAFTVFARLVAVLHNGGEVRLTPDQLAGFDPKRRAPDGTPLVDGQGIFQIFNANGAGVAAFLAHSGTGMNFRDDKLLYARAGDFLKLFWSENVGASEKGHQVIYTGHRLIDGRDMVCFWGSQRQTKKKRTGGFEPLYFPAGADAAVHEGYGEACRPRADIKAMIFSRVTCMEHLPAGLEAMSADARKASTIPYLFVDDYLERLRRTSSDQATLDKTYGILPAPDALAGLDAGSPR